MRELFVYYRVRADDAAAAMLLVRGLHDRLVAQHPALSTRLLRRPEENDGLQTWMEVYAADPRREPGGVSTALQAAIEAQSAALLPLLAGRRHTEVFVACAR